LRDARRPPPPLCRKLVRLGIVSSTNDVARQLAEAGWPEGTVVVAEEQTVGRGRFGRRWESPRGGLWFSILLKPELGAEDVARLPIVAGLAVARALRNSLGLSVELKWPNDVLIKGKKVCGILVESSFTGEQLAFLILGIGINANFDPDELPEPISSSSTSLRAELGRDVDLDALLFSVLHELSACYETLLSGRGEELLREAEELMGLPRRARILSGGRELVGLAIGLADDGSLLLRTEDGHVEKVVWWEATIIELGS